MRVALTALASEQTVGEIEEAAVESGSQAFG